MNYNNFFKTGQIFIVCTLIILCSCKCRQLGNTAGKTESKVTKGKNLNGTDASLAQNSIGIAAKDSVLKKNLEVAVQEPFRLVISFISIGSGINLSAKEKLENYLQLNELLKMKNPEIERNPWGREGEVDFCMKLSSFTSIEQEKIVKGIREQLKNQEHIFIEENAICRHKRRGVK